jgi:hypothetical protein
LGAVCRDACAGIGGKPHGLDYSLTLHGPDGERLVGFDNPHPVGPQRSGSPRDHQHRLRTVRPYEYRDASTCWLTSGRRSIWSCANEE